MYFLVGCLFLSSVCLTYISFTYKDEKIIQRTVYHGFPQSENKPMKEFVLSIVASKGIDRRVAEKLIYCESRWDENAVSETQDRGLWQISKLWHSEVSDDCAFDYKCSTGEAIRIYKESGNSFRQWSCNKIIN